MTEEREDGTAQLVDEDGDAQLSSIELDLWKICTDVQKRFMADVVFTHSGCDVPNEMDGFIDFYVPRDHPQFDVIAAELVARLEPVRSLIVEHDRSRKMRWTPDMIVRVRPYSGIEGAKAFNAANRAFMQEALESGGFGLDANEVLDGAKDAAERAAGEVAKRERRRH